MLFSVKSMTLSRVKVATIEVGMATAAMSTERRLRMNSITTRLASRLPNSRCSSSDFTDALMKTDWSRMILSSTPGGSVVWIWASLSFTAAMIWTVLVPDCRRTSSVTACRPPSVFHELGSAKLSSTRPRSLTRTGLPPALATMMLLNCSTADSRPRVRTPSSDSPRTMRPPGVSTFSFWIAASNCLMVSP